MARRVGEDGLGKADAAACVASRDLTRLVSYRVAVLGRNLARAGGAAYHAALGLNLPQWRVLATLGHFGELPATAIAERAMMARGQTSRTLEALRHAGLLHCGTDAADGRKSLFRLSAAGQARYRDGLVIAEARQARLLDGIDARELARFSAMLDLLVARSNDRNDEA